MEKNNQKQTEIKNLFEDGNFHEHNQKSYEKMMEHQKNVEAIEKKNLGKK